MSQMRITGFASGLDTDKMIRDMMRAGNARGDKMRRDRTSLVWQQEAYRGIIDKLQAFQKNYFDVLKPANNFRSATAFSQFDHSVMSQGKESNAVSISVRADVRQKNLRIDRIDSLASKDQWTGNEAHIRGLKSKTLDLAEVKAAGNLEFSLAVGSSTKKIMLDSAELAGVRTSDDLAAALGAKVASAFGQDFRNVVSVDNGALRFDFSGSEVKMLQFAENAKSLEVLGIRNGAGSYDYRNKSIGELLGLSKSDLENFEINDVAIPLNDEMTVDQMINAVNRSEAGVNLRYNSLSDRFVLQATREGSAHDVKLKDGSAAEKVFGKLLGATDLIAADGSIQQINRASGKNAQVTIDGVSIVKGENSFQYEGVTITLNSLSTAPIDIETKVNSRQVIDKIKEFVKEYNDILGELNSKISEKKNPDFRPLTDEEKEEMTEKQIEKWEEKAKTGILRGSSELSELANRLRGAMIESVEGVGISLRDIGIASANYADRGKLTINEEKLKLAVENRFDDVVSLFTKSSDIRYSDTDKRTRRTKEVGLSHRIDDILRDYARTTRDSEGKKGVLIEKAGLQNDTSYLRNHLSKQIRDYDNRIGDLVKKLAQTENKYYQMFSRMEAAMSKMQAQTNSLFGMFGQGGR